MQPWLKVRTLLLEQLPLRRIVHVDVVLVGEAELDRRPAHWCGPAGWMNVNLRMSTWLQLTWLRIDGPAIVD